MKRHSEKYLPNTNSSGKKTVNVKITETHTTSSMTENGDRKDTQHTKTFACEMDNCEYETKKIDEIKAHKTQTHVEPAASNNIYPTIQNNPQETFQSNRRRDSMADYDLEGVFSGPQSSSGIPCVENCCLMSDISGQNDRRM